MARNSCELHLHLNFVSHADSEVTRRLDAKGSDRNRKPSTHAHSTVTLLSLNVGRPIDRVLLAVQRELSMERYGGPFSAVETDLLQLCRCKRVVPMDLEVLIFQMSVPEPNSGLEGIQ